MKLSKRLLLSVLGGVQLVYLISCRSNHLLILQSSDLLTPPQHCYFINYGLHHRRNDEEKDTNVFL